MKQISLTVLSLLINVQVVAGGAVELQLKEGSEVVVVKAGAKHWFGVGQMSSGGYRQLYAGPTITLAQGLKVGIGAGAERTADDSWGIRGGVFAAYSKEPYSLFALYEDGDVTGPFSKVVGQYQVNNLLKLGIHNQSNMGTGFRIDMSPSTDLTVWGTLFDNGKLLFGLRYSF